MDVDAWRREDPGFTRAVTPRHAYWELLPADVRARLLEKAGRALTWWAGPDSDGRPAAVVVGDRGLWAYRPGGARRGGAVPRPADRVEPLRSRSFDGRPPPDGRTTAPGLPGAPVVRLDLVPEAQGVIGNFPLPVQDFLDRAEWHGIECHRARLPVR
ncbi:hypothetical protein [Streptomyces sp. NPDC090036]|uniref:hypothetical protein n=1 Tax=Streptomyces sp. NPDC090036 TaxID=3365926 RepID=UPI0037FC6627